MSDDSAMPFVETSPSSDSDTVNNPDETKSEVDCPEVDYEVDIETYADSDTEENGKVTAKENPDAATDAETDEEVDSEGDPDVDTVVDAETDVDAGAKVDPDVDGEADVEVDVEEHAEAGDNDNAELTVDDGVEIDAQLDADLFAACNVISSDDITEDSDENNEELPGAKQEDRDQLIDLYTILLYIWTASVMLAIFVFGAVPYLYLNREFDPRYSPLRLIPRSSWDTSNEYYQQVPLQPYKAQRVAVVQTDTEQCDTLEGCAVLILNIERDYPAMKYNFVVSRAGNVYEVLGWSEPSPMYSDKPTMVVAFIGDYEFEQPSELQLEQLNILLAKSVEMRYLSSSYTMVGRKVRSAPSPTKLFERLYEVEGLNWEDSDSEEVSIDFKPFLIDSE